MPGIFGCIDRKGQAIPEEIAVEMTNSLKHENKLIAEWVIDSCLLGVVELKFLHNPNGLLYSNGESLIGVSRGNIYNKKELSKKFGIEDNSPSLNDTRFVVELYEKEGLNFAKHLNGLFVAAILDKENSKVVIANDRYGYSPLFYSLNPKTLAFASEAKATLRVTPESPTPTIDKRAVPEFFTFSFLLGDKTFFKNVKKMSPGNIMTYDLKSKAVNMEQYWDFTVKQTKTGTLESYLKEFANS